MKSLLPILKTKLVLLSFLFTSTLIIATTVTFQIRNNKKEVVAEKIVSKVEKKKTTRKINLQLHDNTTQLKNNLFRTFSNYFVATVQTDLQDYPPGATVHITGSGWTPGETVILQVIHHLANGDNDSSPAHQPWNTTADQDGNISSSWIVPLDEDELGATLLLTADQQFNSLHAETTFTDANQPADYPSLVITSLSSNGPFCPGSVFTVFFEDPDLTHNYLTGNIFTVELSNPGGGFPNTPIPLGSSGVIIGSSVSGQITATVPDLGGVGSNRKLRIVSSNPDAEGAVRLTDIFINAAPTKYNVTGTTSFCPGGSAVISLSNSESGVNYELYLNGTTTNIIVAGTGSAISFPAQSAFGTYTVIGKSTTAPFCTNEMNGSAVFSSSPAPVAPTLTPDPTSTAVCEGTSVKATVTAGSGGTGGADVIQYRQNISPNVGSWNTYSSGTNISTTGFTSVDIQAYRTSTGSGCHTSTTNTVSWVIDATPPAFTGDYSIVTLGCNPSGSDISTALGSATATDGCGTPTVNNGVDGSIVTTDCQRSETRTFTATDAGGKTATISRTVTWTSDMQAPGLTVPGNTNIQCDAAIPSVGSASATDNCDALPTVEYLGEVRTDGSCPNSYTLTRTWKATDACSNTATKSQTITIVDDTKPTVTAPTRVDLECAGDLPAAVTTIGAFNALPGASASDNCTATGSLTVGHSDAVTTPGNCNGVITRTYTITDGCNNSQTVNQVFTITDNTKPTVTAPTGSDIECAGDLPAAVTTIGAFNALPGASASDNCTATGSLTVGHSDAVTTPGSCNGVITRTYTITDGCNNSQTVNQVFTITDNTKPTVTAPTGSDLECAGDLPAAVTTIGAFNALPGASASDNCTATGSLTVGHSDAVTTPGSCNGVITRTYTITDGCNNSQTVNQVFTVTDNTKPTVTAPTGSDLECAGDLPAAVTTIGAFNALPGASASDNCTATGSLTVNHSDAVTTPGNCNGVITRTYTITDGCNNSQTVNQVFTVTDNTKPTVTAPTGSDLECAGDLPAAVTTIGAFNALPGASASDNCTATGSLTVGHSDAVTTPGSCNGVITRTYTITDGCNNSQTVNQVFTVTDNTKPTVTAPTGSDLECAGDLPAAKTTINGFLYLSGATASDNCTATGSLTVNHSDAVTTPGNCNGVITRTYTITDGCNNSQTVNQVFTVTDNTKPTVTAPTGSDLECAGDLPAAVTTIGAFNALPGASASDNCTATGSLTVGHSDAVTTPGSCNGVITRTYTITDGCNNSQTVNQVFTITDNTKPTVTAPTGSDLECAGDLPAAVTTIGAFNALPGASASDNCTATGSLTVGHSDAVTTPGSCNGVITRTYTITDGCNNSQTVNQVFTVTDNTKPTVTAPTGSDLECAGDLPAAVTTIGAFNALPGASASDNCTATGSLTVGHSDAVTTPGSCNGVITRTYTITDGCNNSQTVNQVFTITDNTKPTVTAPTGSDLECAGDLPAAVTTIGAFNALPGASASDNCTATGSLTVNHSDAVTTPGSCNGVITRTYTITDGCNNSQTVNQVFTVTDNTKPTVTAPTGSDLECAGDLPAAKTTINGFLYLSGATASDNCTATGSLTVNYSDAVTTPGNCNGVITRTYTITDGCNNSQTVNQVFTITDNTKPTVTAPTGSDLECAGDLPAAVTTIGAFNALPGASASDNCTATGSLTVGHSDAVTTPGSCNGVITRTYTITDGCNNSQTVNQVFTVTDNTKPTVKAPNTVDIECANAIPAAKTTISGFLYLTGATASDNCTPTASLTVSSTTSALDGTSCNGTITRTYTISDACGNIATVNQVFTVTDNTVPTASCKNITVILGTDGTADITASDVNNGSSDNCDASVGLTIDKSHFTDAEVGTASCSRDFTVKLTATDDCGNTSTCNATVTVNKRITKLVYSGDVSGQYSDPVNVKATLYDMTGGEPGVAIEGKTIKFTIGSQNVTAVTNASGVASASITLNQNPTPTYNVVSCFVADGAYCGSTDTKVFDITPEKACGAYTTNGTLFINTSSASGGSATVHLEVLVTEEGDGNLGDLANATVTFTVTDGASTSTYLATRDVSTFSKDITISLSSSQLCKTLDVSWTIGNYYTNATCPEQSTQVTVAAPADDFSAGGGYIVLTNNAYGPNIGGAGIATGKNNWGYNVKWNKSLTNLQGNFNTIIRKNGRTYQVKSNKPTFLKITLLAAATPTTPARRKAEITYGNATLKDVTDIVNGVCTAPGGVCWGDGNGTIYLTVEDNGEPGSTGSTLDKIGFAVKDKNNNLWYSTNVWANPTSTITLQNIDGGNIQIRQASSAGAISNQTVNTDITTDVTPVILPFNVKAFPNPSANEFSLYLEGANNDKVHIVVYDALGREVKKFEKEGGNIPVIFGRDLKGGVYFVEVRQGENHKTIKLIKQN